MESSLLDSVETEKPFANGNDESARVQRALNQARFYNIESQSSANIRSLFSLPLLSRLQTTRKVKNLQLMSQIENFQFQTSGILHLKKYLQICCRVCNELSTAATE